MDFVSIRVPASPEYVQVVRLVAAGVASRLGFTLEDIDDLKIGVDELASYLTGTQGTEGFLELRFEVHEGRLEIRGTARLRWPEKVRTDLSELSRMILQTVADSASLQRLDGVPTFHLTKMTRS